MGRPRDPRRDAAKDLFLARGGNITTKELAEKAGVPDSTIRKGKSLDGWQTALDKKKSKRRRGGQPGNKNAVGAGAPIGNRNAETHGAYSTVHLQDLSEEDRQYIESIGLDSAENMTRELQLLTAKERDLRRRIKALEDETADTLHTDKVIEMLTPQGQQDGQQDSQGDSGTGESLKTAMRTVIKSSPFDRAMKLEAELNKIHGRIIKLIDSIKGYEMEARRLELEERRFRFAKQRATGEYSIDPETGEIDDTQDHDGEEGPEL